MSLFGAMNWLYTWYNPRVDPDAAALAEEMSDIFLRGLRGNAVTSAEPQLERLSTEKSGSRAMGFVGGNEQGPEANPCEGPQSMSSTTKPASSEVKRLIHYRTESGVALIELNDPPANTYSYEMNRQLDDAVWRRAWTMMFM